MGKAAKKTAVLAIAAAIGFAAPITLYAAGTHYLEPVTAADVLPAYEILTRVRTLALDPIGEPVRRGPYYVLHAYDRRGTEVRVVADAQFGDVLSVRPAVGFLPGIEYGAGLVGGARIIHVPGPGEGPVSVEPRGEPAVQEAEPDEPAPPPRRRPQVKPRPHPKKSEREVRRRPFASAPPSDHRSMLSAPATSGDPSPIRPTPHFAGDERADTFAPPPPATATVVPPPPPPAESPVQADAAAPPQDR
jgi:hypothetical protein